MRLVDGGSAAFEREVAGVIFVPGTAKGAFLRQERATSYQLGFYIFRRHLDSMPTLTRICRPDGSSRSDGLPAYAAP